MWELKKLPSYEGTPLRSILAYALSAIIAAFLWVLVVIPSAHAADAGWSGSDVSYNSKTFSEETADGAKPPSLSKGTKYYVRTEVTDVLSGAGKAYVIYFDGSSPDTATKAKYAIYNIDGGGSYGSRESGPTDISITPKNASASPTQAAWKGTSIEYDGKTFTGSNGSARVADGNTPAGLSSGIKYYQAMGAPDLFGNGSAFILYFPASSTPGTEKQATFQEYEVKDGKLAAKKGNARTISLTPAADSPGTNANGEITKEGSTCAIDGVGWIVCPVSNFLATGMDWIFDQLKAYMVYQPLTNQTNSLYQAWNVARSFANIIFVIAFLIIIYSQLTSMGVSNYGIKKLLPRLIIAAILVNISYYICAVAIDLSNILGDSVQKIFIMLRESLRGTNPNDIGGWESMTSFVLAGGTAAAAAAAGIGITIASTGASPAAAALLLLPMLVALVLAVLVALVVLAARQAVITLLVIVSPLAFVAFLLPNTDEWFTRWRKTLTTLLVFFPLFSLVFGGSQLAGFLIIQNTDQLNIILLGMFVQVAPIVLTPLLIKFSGSLVGRIAGMVNNPGKGLIDRTKKWSQDQSQHLAKRNMARQDPVRRRQAFRRFALGMDQMRRAQEERDKVYSEQADTRWTGSQEYSDIQQRLRYAQDQKSVNVEEANIRYEASKAVAGAVQNLDINVRDAKLRLDNAKVQADITWDQNHSPAVVEERLRARVLKDQLSTIHATHDAEYEEFKNGDPGHNPRTAGVMHMLAQSQEDTRRIALDAMRSESAKRAINEQFAQEIEANAIRIDGRLLQTYAGGVQGVVGAQRALATAISTQASAQDQSIKNATAILSHGNYADSTITQIALGDSANTGIIVTDDMRRAAIRKIAGGPNTDEIISLMRDIEISTGADNLDFRQEFVDALMANGSRPKFAGAGIMAGVKQGNAPAPGKGRLDQWIVETTNANKFSTELLVQHDKSYLESLKAALQDNQSATMFDTDALTQLQENLRLAFSDNRYRAQMGERIGTLQDIQGVLDGIL